ncbi:hypothetical protein Hanom_Chr17g01566841 [Helianthus anomalus]
MKVVNFVNIEEELDYEFGYFLCMKNWQSVMNKDNDVEQCMLQVFQLRVSFEKDVDKEESMWEIQHRHAADNI